jgi:hypothetical protein
VSAEDRTWRVNKRVWTVLGVAIRAALFRWPLVEEKDERVSLLTVWASVFSALRDGQLRDVVAELGFVSLPTIAWLVMSALGGWALAAMTALGRSLRGTAWKEPRSEERR